VAGSIALLYSAPCSAFTNDARNNPSQAALRMKEFILSGVDTTNQLLSEMVSGGRLNVHNSMQLLINSCDNGDCMAPYALEITQLPGTLNYIVSWSDLLVTDDYRLEYRPVGNDEWIVVELDNINVTTIENLLACTSYEARVAAYCTDSLSDWSQPVLWQTDGCCTQPETISVTASSSSSLSLQWSEVLAAGGYNISVSDEDGNVTYWQAALTDTATLIGLTPCTQYTISIQSQCDNPQGVAPATEGFTPGCEDCALIPYCTTSGNASVEYIEYVQVGDIVRNSVSDGGYILVNDISDTLIAGEYYTVTCMPGYTGTNYNENFRVWIDYTIDGDFDDENELVFDPQATTTQVTGGFTVPLGITQGISRMRVSMAYTPINSNNEPSPCGNLVYGEVEDYCVTLSSSLGIANASESKGILMPNPAASWIQLVGVSNQPRLLEVMSSDGRSIVLLNVDQWPRVSLPYLPNGSYFVRALQDKGYSAWPLIIAH
jgi:hypothetical protein